MKSFEKRLSWLILVICLSLLINLTNCSEARSEGLEQTIIRENEPAPFSGVLVPEDMYRQMHIDIFAENKFYDEFGDCLKQRETLLSEKNEPKLWNFETGLIFGIFAGLLLHK